MELKCILGNTVVALRFYGVSIRSVTVCAKNENGNSGQKDIMRVQHGGTALLGLILR